MAFGARAAAGAAMVVINTPTQELALTNCAFCSAGDVRSFSAGGSGPALALVGDSVVLSLRAHQGIQNGHIALNALQRRQTKVSTGDTVSVSRFILPENFKLALLTLEVDFIKAKTNTPEQLDAVVLAQQLRKRLIDQVMTVGQRVPFEYCGMNFFFTVNQALVEGQEVSTSGTVERGIISEETYMVFEASPNSGIKIVNQREAASSNIFRQKEFNLQKLGIGGLSDEFTDIFRRAFASRVFPTHVTNKLGIKHVKGILLYGPPGTGKTLMARQIGKLLNGREPKIVNGPEVLSKFVGETEKNVRDLFADAEQDQRTRGDQSDLHVIIFDEIDAICKSRGSTRDGTGVHDSIVNQLLTKIDGVESLNNVLLIGMTNRKDLLDEALLRPGRLEVHIEINLPDENGRLQILQIHTNKMKENSFLAADVNLQALAARTKNYSGAELEGVVKSAVSFALNRQISLDDLTKPLDEESIKVTMDDFLHALQEIPPAFGASTDDLERCRLNGIVECGDRHRHIYERAMLLVEQVKGSKGSPLLTCLLEGPAGSGKTAMAATIGLQSDFPYVKIISAESMIGLSESSKSARIVKVFEDAYRSQLSIIILDDIERLLEYVPIGPRFSNVISQTLMVLLKRLPPKGKNLLVIGTTSDLGFLESLGVYDAFSVTYHVPVLKADDARKVLQKMNVFHEHDLDAAAEALDKSRGSTRDGTGVHDSIVNQLLTKIDGVESLNNVLLIGMTNRKDLLDEALLRPGRLEVHIEINLPDENGRLQILQIHTNKMKENSFLAADVNLQALAARTKNYSGAELEGVVKSAVSFALNRQISLDDLTKPLDEESIKVTMDDFLHALQEIPPAFGASTDDLERCRLNGIVECGDRHRHIYERAMLLVEQVKGSKGSPLLTCLLEGPAGSGKTAMAATIGLQSDFPYVKIISAESMIGLSESSKSARIVKVFEDAYRSQLSIIILDDIERLLEYVPIGPRFSNVISQTLMVLLKRLPPKGKNLLVIGTTSDLGFLESLGVYDAFSVTYHVPVLKADDARKVLQKMNVFHEHDLDAAAEALDKMPLKKLYMLVEMAAQGETGGSSEAIYSGQERINVAHFFDCLSDVTPLYH